MVLSLRIVAHDAVLCSSPIFYRISPILQGYTDSQTVFMLILMVFTAKLRLLHRLTVPAFNFFGCSHTVYNMFYREIYKLPAVAQLFDKALLLNEPRSCLLCLLAKTWKTVMLSCRNHPLNRIYYTPVTGRRTPGRFHNSNI